MRANPNEGNREAEHTPDQWAALSEPSFAKDWDNEMDAVYDRWAQIYSRGRLQKNEPPRLGLQPDSDRPKLPLGDKETRDRR